MVERTKQWTGTENLRALLSREGSHVKAAALLGTAPSTISGWAQEGRLPVIADLATQQVLMNTGAAAAAYIVVVKAPAHKVALEAVLEAMNLPFTKQEI